MLIEFKKNKELKRAKRLYNDFYKINENVIKELMDYFNNNNMKTAIWGGGLKGIAFLDLFDVNRKYITCVFDIDKGKWGTQTITGHIITSYEDLKFGDIDVVMIMNNNYETEIAGRLREKHVMLFNIDSIIFGMMSTKEALQLYERKL